MFLPPPGDVPLASAKDGTILASETCAITRSYSALDGQTRETYSKQLYEEARNQDVFECRRVTYMSDGLRVVGYVYAPKSRDSGPLPTILYAPGGTAGFYVIDETTFVRFYTWAKQGFAILATNYRGRGGSEGLDTWGGDDVDDLLNLVSLGRSLGYVDMDNLFLVGASRGGMMATLSLKRGIPVRAAAIIGGAVDLASLARRRPEFIEGWKEQGGWPGWKGVWPEFEKRRDEHLRERSAVHWAERINAPILILHSRTDEAVHVEQALAFAKALQAREREYELVIYADDSHALHRNREDRDARLIGWFRRHMKPPS
jgi:dipeptidyl aminopeptidase/acylaminoacyl peptidase